MTSIPASRRARAMILAPRSCPSRPGLATTTRILRAVAASIRPGTLARQGVQPGSGADAQAPWRRHATPGGNPRGAEAGDGGEESDGEGDEATAEALEAQRLPALLAGDRRQRRVGVDRHRVADGAQHRQVGE